MKLTPIDRQKRVSLNASAKFANEFHFMVEKSYPSMLTNIVEIVIASGTTLNIRNAISGIAAVIKP